MADLQRAAKELNFDKVNFNKIFGICVGSFLLVKGTIHFYFVIVFLEKSGSDSTFSFIIVFTFIFENDFLSL